MKRDGTQWGFSLIELLITISLMAIALSIAMPSYRSFMANNRSATEVNRFLAAVNIARSEAVKRGTPVTLCARKLPRTLPETCSGATDWATGWLLFSDTSGSKGVFDASDALLYVWDKPEGSPTITGSASNIQYLSTGETQQTASFSYYFPDCRGEQRRSISLSLTGRASVATTAC